MAVAFIAKALSVASMLLAFGATPASAGPAAKGLRGKGRRIEVRVLEDHLREFLAVIRAGGDGAGARRLAKIEASMASTFQALPKNEAGRLAPRSVRYIVHNYFAKEHGWLIRGLEPHAMRTNVSELHEVSILQDKAPALVEAMLEDRESNRGLSLVDVAAMAASLERLVLDESADLLEAAYMLNGLDPEVDIDEAGLHEVLASYLLIFRRGGTASGVDSEKHQILKMLDAQKAGSALTVREFEHDAVLNFKFAHHHAVNPFASPAYPFEVVSHIVESLTTDYGKWQDAECRAMKSDLMELVPDNTGRVPLKQFYSSSASADYQFTESVQYLKQIGALDESTSQPRVRIANYLAGPSNCIASSSYFSVCCLSECEILMNELEGTVQAPAASHARLLHIVANLSSSSVDAPRELPVALADRLRAIAERHDGQVPLHGRLFAEWLHLAFPNECPYPVVSEDAAALTPSAWVDGRHAASVEERQRHIQAAFNLTHEDQVSMPMWSEEEILPLHESRTGVSTCRDVLHIAMQLAMFLMVLRAAAAGWKAAMDAHTSAPWGKGKKAKVEDMALPF